MYPILDIGDFFCDACKKVGIPTMVVAIITAVITKDAELTIIVTFVFMIVSGTIWLYYVPNFINKSLKNISSKSEDN